MFFAIQNVPLYIYFMLERGKKGLTPLLFFVYFFETWFFLIGGFPMITNFKIYFSRNATWEKRFIRALNHTSFQGVTVREETVFRAFRGCSTVWVFRVTWNIAVVNDTLYEFVASYSRFILSNLNKEKVLLFFLIALRENRPIIFLRLWRGCESCD